MRVLAPMGVIEVVNKFWSPSPSKTAPNAQKSVQSAHGESSSCSSYESHEDKSASLHHECKGRIEELERVNRDQAEEIKALKKENHNLRRELKALELVRHNQDEDLKLLEKDKHALSRELKDLERAKHDQGEELKQLLKGNSVLRRGLQESQATNQEAERNFTTQITHLRTALDDCQTTLNARNTELQSANRFLTTGDTIAVSDVLRAVEELNNNIFQFAAGLADVLCFDADFSVPLPPNLSKGFGTLLGTLQPDKLDPSLSVQIVTQNVLSALAESLLRSWCIVSSEISRNMELIYTQMTSQGYDPTLATWRSITRSRLRPAEDSYSGLVDDVLSVLHQVLCATGWRPTEGVSAVPHALSGYRDRLSPVVKRILNLNKAFGEQVLSTDLYPLFVSSGTPFEGSQMTDAYPVSDSVGQFTVLCTTGLGVVSRTPGSSSRSVVLRSSVALTTILESH